MLRKEMEVQGNWLFRWRSYVPFLILPALLIALRDSELIEKVAGEDLDTCWELFCLVVALGGLAVRSFTVGCAPKKTSGRNTKCQRASVLNTTGMYSVVRHPLYLGNCIIFSGMLLFVQVLWFCVLGVLAFWLYYERIMVAEEAFLEAKFGAEYIAWAQRTPAFFPRFRNWVQPALPFSFKSVLRREYTGFFVIVTSFALLDTAGDLLGEGIIKLDLGWLALFVFGLVSYLVLLTLKRKTKILNVEGR